MFRRSWALLALLTGLCLTLGTGCSSDKEKGINKGSDRPVAPSPK